MITWSNKLNTFGAEIVYFSKKIVTNYEARINSRYETAKGIFKGTNLNITNEIKRHLGAVVGTNEYRNEYMIMRANEWLRN